jgi:putative CocE/NonD family hydrolase
MGRANSLFGDGTLSTSLPAAEPADSYTSDPEHPVPFITEPSFAQIGSAEDYRPVERRDDVLVYTSEPLAEHLTVCGPIKVELYASSTAKDTDFMGMLIDVWPEGYAQRLIDGMVRARYRGGMDKASLIEPGKVYAYTLDLWNTCQTFKKGHRIRLQIASSAFPKYDRNAQTGDNLAKATELQKAEQRIYHDKNRPSHIVLPVVPKK